MGDGSIKENFKRSGYEGKPIVLFSWPLGASGMKPDAKGVADYLAKHAAEL